MTYIEELTNDPWNNLDYNECEGDKGVCPLCRAGVVRVWYLTVFNQDGDYLESLTSDKCDNDKCGYERFYIEE